MQIIEFNFNHIPIIVTIVCITVLFTVTIRIILQRFKENGKSLSNFVRELVHISLKFIIIAITVEELLIFAMACVLFIFLRNAWLSFLISYIIHGLLHFTNYEYFESVKRLIIHVVGVTLSSLLPYIFLTIFLTPFEAYIVLCIIHYVWDLTLIIFIKTFTK